MLIQSRLELVDRFHSREGAVATSAGSRGGSCYTQFTLYYGGWEVGLLGLGVLSVDLVSLSSVGYRLRGRPTGGI